MEKFKILSFCKKFRAKLAVEEKWQIPLEKGTFN